MARWDLLARTSLTPLLRGLDLQRGGSLARLVYDVLWRTPTTRTPERRLASLLALTFRTFVRDIRRASPDLLIATHALPALLAVHAVRDVRRRPRIVCVATDFMVHGHWPTRAVDLICVATEKAKRVLIRRGAPPARVLVSGIPLRPQFALPTDRKAARQHLCFSGQPVLLVIAGARDRHAALYNNVRQELAALVRAAARDPSLTVSIVCGTDADLQTTIAHSAREAHTDNVHVFGYREDMQTLMRAADLLLAKPGGLLAAEALAVGLPMLLLGPNVGQERANEEYLVASGAAMRLRGPDILPVVRSLFAQPEKLSAMRDAARRHGIPHATDTIVRAALAR